jgi:chlorophyllide a reductase subunit X
MNAPDQQVIFMQDQRLKAEAAIEPDPCHLAGGQDDADHRHLRQGRHRQEFHAGQPELHDGAAGQEGAADRLRPQERHHQPAVWRPGLPDHHRNVFKKKLAGEAVAIGDVCFKRDGVYAMELGGPEVGRGCGGRGIIHGFETAGKAGLPRLGLSTTCCSTSWATWCAAASACRLPATCARR